MGERTGFAVLYRWRVDPAAEEAFVAAWEALTVAIAREHGGLGSRLHRLDDAGSWAAYAQWPSREAWAASRATGSADPAAAAALGRVVLEAFPPLLMTPVRDLLAHPWPARSGGA
jgi:quinol monooxygenase YgiN